LHQQARDRLIGMGYGRIRFRHGDGYQGWTEYGPFDGIIVTAAAPSVPDALLRQLAPEGRMVIPVGRPGMQKLKLIRRGTKGYEQTDYDPVSFVPLLGGLAS
jgi:protein-L-isoaspartate(D-aspartate) O-methyltransferase